MGEKAAQETAEQWKQNHRVPMSIITFQKKLSESLNQLGYSAVLKTEGKKVIITTQNCLFWEVSRKYEGLICNFHNAYYPTLFSLMAGHQVIAVERAMCKGRGDPRCRLEMMPA